MSKMSLNTKNEQVMSEETDEKNEIDVSLLLTDVKSQLDQMNTTFNRRLDEISAEVNATCQMVGMSEDSLKGNFSEVLDTIQGIAYSGDGNTAANTGVELDAVVKATDKAANTILDQADQLSMFIEACYEHGWANDEERKETMDRMKLAVQEIILACSFQDITGQRIRKTLESIEDVETRLSESLSKLGIQQEPSKKEKTEDTPPKAAAQETSTQADIDALFD